MTIASRIAVMNEGRIVQTGAPDQVYENPANRFVAGFLGAVNLFAGRVTGADRGLLLVDSEAGPLIVEHDALPPGREVAVAVRPEKLRLTTTPLAGARNSLFATLRTGAFRGEASTYEVEIAGGKKVRVTVPNRERRAGGLEPGAPVFLSFAPDAARALET